MRSMSSKPLRTARHCADIQRVNVRDRGPALAQQNSVHPHGHLASQVALTVKTPACQCRRRERCNSVPGSGRSPGEGHGYPLQYSCLKNPMDWGVSSDGDEPGRKRDHHGSSLLLPGSQGPGIQGRQCGPGSAKRGNSKKQHWAPPLQSLLSAS